MYQPTNGEFSAVGNAVKELVKTRDAARFTTRMAADFEDYRSIAATNTIAGRHLLKSFKTAAISERRQVEISAKGFLAKADALHLDFSNGDWHVSMIPPRYAGSINYGVLQAKGEGLPYLSELEMILASGAKAGNSSNGVFKIAIRNLIKFPGGWRTTAGIQWELFPSNVADAETVRELAILDKLTNYRGIHNSMTSQDDPALLKLGESLVQFIQKQDTNIYQKDALMNGDLLWAQRQRSGQSGGPSRREFDRQMSVQVNKQVELERSALKQMDEAGIDLKNANIQIKDASIEDCQLPDVAGSLDGLRGYQFRLTLAVKSAGQSRTKAPLSGDYVLAANEIMRFENGWRIMNGLRWDEFPPGVVDAAAEKKLKFENYVAEHRALPPGMMAPEIQFITLNGEKKMKLSDLHGKVVVLDFWATWCGPCQEPMAALQKIRVGHPNWGDKVAIVPLSIDDTIGVVRKHVQARGWTNTFNVWAGDGGWNCAPIRAFRVTGVPTMYIIDAKGKIVLAGYPVESQIADTVDRLIKL